MGNPGSLDRAQTIPAGGRLAVFVGDNADPVAADIATLRASILQIKHERLTQAQYDAKASARPSTIDENTVYYIVG